MPPASGRDATRRVAVVGALFPAAERGLTADLFAARALRLHALPVCTALAMASRSRVTDFVEVPEDAVRSQLEHIDQVGPPGGAKIGVLAQHGTARAVLEWADRLEGPVVLDLQVSGPAGETVLSQRGLSEVLDRLGIPDVVVLDRTDAELVSGGEIHSLDDAQVAVQRIVGRGARAVVLKAGVLPARHFDVARQENGAPSRFATDLLYDGREFALFEAPWLEDAPDEGASSAHTVALLRGLLDRESLEEAARSAKAYVTDVLNSTINIGGERFPRYFLHHET